MRIPKITGYQGEYDVLLENTPFGGTVSWSPGDGTRYFLVARRLEFDESQCLSAPPGAMMVSLSTDGQRWSTIIVVEGNLCHISYFAEKMPRGMDEYTLNAYTALLNLVLGNESYGVTLAEKLNRR